MADPIGPCRDAASKQYDPFINDDTQYEVTQTTSFYKYDPNCKGPDESKSCDPTATPLGELPAGAVVEDVVHRPQATIIGGKTYQFVEICGATGKNVDQYVLIEAAKLNPITASMK